MFERSGPEVALSQDNCRARLARSRRGVLACTERALPAVVQAQVELRHGRLFVTVNDPALRDRLVGQVVALGIGRHSTRLRKGWRVVARGQLLQADNEEDLALTLDSYRLDGRTFGRHR